MSRALDHHCQVQECHIQCSNPGIFWASNLAGALIRQGHDLGLVVQSIVT